TSALRETRNSLLILEQIRIKTGLIVVVLANSEQRLLDYKSIILRGNRFQNDTEKGTAIIDIGGGSIQISLFEEGSIVTTQNIRLGVLRLRDKLMKLKPVQSQIEGLVDELIMNQFSTFKKLYLKDIKIETVSIVDDYVSVLFPKERFHIENDEIEIEIFDEFVRELRENNKEELSKQYPINADQLVLLHLASIILKRITEIMNVKSIWAPGVSLCDGIAYEYAYEQNCLPKVHDFDRDVIHSAYQVNRKYEIGKKRTMREENNATLIFHAAQKLHGLGERELLLLRTAAILHDTGKYISLSLVGESSYSIIMGTEIIGLSHKERIIVACVAKYTHVDYDYYIHMSQLHPIDHPMYLIIGKLTAMLRVASVFNKSHKVKLKEIKAFHKGSKLLVTVDSAENILLERGLVEERSKLFEDVFGVSVTLKQKRNL
ncbi:MAG: exopolyphosphatase, partial [Eubacteriales bacterium]